MEESKGIYGTPAILIARQFADILVCIKLFVYVYRNVNEI